MTGIPVIYWGALKYETTGKHVIATMANISANLQLRVQLLEALFLQQLLQ